MESEFLEKSYQMPETSNYFMKGLPEGEHPFRVMSSAIAGFEYFSTENKPFRSKKPFEETPNIKYGEYPKHFLAFVVWNYNAKKLQIMSITQKTIMQPLIKYANNEKWGNPADYDLILTKEGSGKMDTKYSLMSSPKEPISEEIQSAYEKAGIDMNKLFTGENPFSNDGK